MKVNYFRIIFLFLALVTVVLIFMMSAQTATVSSRQSGKFIVGIAKVLVKDFESYDTVARDLLISEYQRFVRKLAHFVIYAALGFFSNGFLVTYKSLPRKLCFLISLAFCMFYACTDEFHQYFVPGRSCMFSDVVLDCFGAATGIFVFIVTLYIFNRLRGFLNARKSK